MSLHHSINYRSRIEAWTKKDKAKRLYNSYNGNKHAIEGIGEHPVFCLISDGNWVGKRHSRYPRG